MRSTRVLVATFVTAVVVLGILQFTGGPKTAPHALPTPPSVASTPGDIRPESPEASEARDVAFSDPAVAADLDGHRYLVSNTRALKRSAHCDQSRSCYLLEIVDYTEGSTVSVVVDETITKDSFPWVGRSEVFEAYRIVTEDPSIQSELGAGDYSLHRVEGWSWYGRSGFSCDLHQDPRHRCIFFRIASGDEFLYVWVDLTSQVIVDYKWNWVEYSDWSPPPPLGAN